MLVPAARARAESPQRVRCSADAMPLPGQQRASPPRTRGAAAARSIVREARPCRRPVGRGHGNVARAAVRADRGRPWSPTRRRGAWSGGGRRLRRVGRGRATGPDRPSRARRRGPARCLPPRRHPSLSRSPAVSTRVTGSPPRSSATSISVAGRARMRRDDRHVAPRERVEQARLARHSAARRARP